MGAATPPLYFEVDTFTPLRERGEALAEWADRLRSELIDPIVSTFPQDRFQVVIDQVPFAGGSAAEYRYSDRNWGRLRNALAAGELMRFGIDTKPLGPELFGILLGQKRGGQLSFGIDLPDPDFDRDPARIWMSVPSGALERVEAWQERVVDLTKGLARDFEAATGYITPAVASPTESPDEERSDIDPFEVLEHVDTMLRGVYWANVLSARHIGRLGGMQRIRADAPAAVVEDLSDGAATLAWVQLTKSVLDVPVAELAALRAFFTPVLPGAGRRGRDETAEPATTRATVGFVAAVRNAFGGEAPNEQFMPHEEAVTLPIERTPSFDENYPDVAFTLTLREQPSGGERERLERLLDGWYEVAVHGGFAGHVHNMSGIHLGEDEGRPTVEWTVDFGDASDQALDALLRALEDFLSQEGLAVERFVLGRRLLA
jgi:hypothetical protein